RPILSAVISIVLILLGIIGSQLLPITRFPEIAPPSVTVSLSYPGANAETVAESVLLRIEEAINGVDGMTYISSKSSNRRSSTITINFAAGVNPDEAAVNVQNSVSKDIGEIPSDVDEAVITVTARQRGNIITIK